MTSSSDTTQQCNKHVVKALLPTIDDDDESMKLVFAGSYSLKNSHNCANEDML